MGDNSNLGDADLGRGYDDVDIFGLDEFGDPTGLGAMWGAAVGVGAGTLCAIGARSFGGMSVLNSELVGLGAAVVAGGVMAAMPKTRHAGWVAIGSGLLGNGLRALEAYMSSASIATQFHGGYGQVSFQAQRGYTAGMNGAMGIVQAQPLNGGGGMAGMNGLSNPSRQLQLMGGPKISPLAARFGHSYLLPGR